MKKEKLKRGRKKLYEKSFLFFTTIEQLEAVKKVSAENLMNIAKFVRESLSRNIERYENVKK